MSVSLFCSFSHGKTQSGKRTFHMCCSKPLTFHNGFMFLLLVAVSNTFSDFKLHLFFVGGVYSAREQDSSLSEGTGNNCLGVVHTEGGVQDRVQVEVGREEQGEGETHGESQNEETTRNKRSTTHNEWHEYGVTSCDSR